MLSTLKRLVGAAAPGAEPGAREDRIMTATCVLLLEVAHADGEFHEMENTLLDDLLSEKFGLPPDARAELIEYAGGKRESSPDLFRFTRQINDHFSRQEKLEIMKACWRIVYADGVLDRYEDFLIRRFTTLLRLSHRDMIDTKVAILDEVGRENIGPGN